MVDDADWDKIVDEVYGALDPSMNAEQVHDKIKEIVEDYGITDTMDLVTIGIFAGDVWRPVGEDEEDLIDEVKD